MKKIYDGLLVYDYIIKFFVLIVYVIFVLIVMNFFY